MLKPSDFTENQLSVARLLARGELRVSICDALGISMYALNSREKSIKKKLGARDRTQAAAMLYGIFVEEVEADESLAGASKSRRKGRYDNS